MSLNPCKNKSKNRNKLNDACVGLKRYNKSLNYNSNLTPGEIAGLKSLRKRIEAGELVITETDKSKRFCL